VAAEKDGGPRFAAVGVLATQRVAVVLLHGLGPIRLGGTRGRSLPFFWVMWITLDILWLVLVVLALLLGQLPSGDEQFVGVQTIAP